jgi:hypothetical protein
VSRGRSATRFLPVTLASVAAGGLFIVGLAVAAFLLRDVHFVPPPAAPRPRPRPPPVVATEGDAGPSTIESTLGVEERRSARQVAAAFIPRCFATAREKDPSMPGRVQLHASLRADDASGTIVAVRMGHGASPYFDACISEALVGARFPVGEGGEAEVRWQVSVAGDQGVVEELP